MVAKLSYRKKPKRWMQSAFGNKKRNGSLRRQLGIPEGKLIPPSLLAKINSAPEGSKVKNPSETGKKEIAVTGKLKKEVNPVITADYPQLREASSFNKELNQDLKKDIIDEKHDSTKYRGQSVEAKKAGRLEDAKELEGISHQEAEHGKKDERMLNYPDPPKADKYVVVSGRSSHTVTAKNEEEAKKKFHEKFPYADERFVEKVPSRRKSDSVLYNPNEKSAAQISAEADKEQKAQSSRIRIEAGDARDRGSTVPYSLGTMIDAGVPVDTMRKVYREGAG
jgi:hypothetical protein